jgi:phage/plasmid-like protein (TIGR03299 family)
MSTVLRNERKNQMAHEINELANGVHSFVSARESAWHKLGVTLENTFDAATALESAHLKNWNVRKHELFTMDDNGNPIQVDNRWATVYTNPVTNATQYLGVVGSHYKPIQNEEHIDLLDTIVDESGAHFETAGSLRQGREVFVSMKVPSSMNVGGIDPVDLYLVALNSHDGTSTFKFLVTPVRVVCANTQAAALNSAKYSFSVRHTTNAGAVVQEAREALKLTFKYADEFQIAADRMIQEAFTEEQFAKLVKDLFPVEEEASTRQVNSSAKHVDGMWDLWNNSTTLGQIAGTRWGAYQVLHERQNFKAVGFRSASS